MEPHQEQLPEKKKMHPVLVVVVALGAVMGALGVAALGILGLIAYTCSK